MSGTVFCSHHKYSLYSNLTVIYISWGQIYYETSLEKTRTSSVCWTWRIEQRALRKWTSSKFQKHHLALLKNQSPGCEVQGNLCCWLLTSVSRLKGNNLWKVSYRHAHTCTCSANTWPFLSSKGCCRSYASVYTVSLQTNYSWHCSEIKS